MAVNYLTLRSTISYATDGSQAPINSLMAVSSVGVTTWTNRIAISTLTASTITASTVSFSTMTVSTLNTFVVGQGAGTGAGNTVFGLNAATANTTGSGNTSFGFSTMSTNTTGIANTAMGYMALASNISSFNTAMGYAALASNISTMNTAVGALVMQNNTSGTLNVGIGYGALTSATNTIANTAVGTNAITTTTTGSYNTAIGMQTLFYNTTGQMNTCLGYSAGLSGAGTFTGSYNTYLGHLAYPSGMGVVNEIVLGGSSTNLVANTGNGSNSVTIGNSATTKHIFTAGNLGIGTANPTAILSVLEAPVNGDVSRKNMLLGLRDGTGGVQNAVSMALALGPNVSTIEPYGSLDIKLNGLPVAGNNYGAIPNVTVMSIIGNGYVGIGITNPDMALDVRNTTGGDLKMIRAGFRFYTTYTTGDPVVAFRLGWYDDTWDIRGHRTDTTAIQRLSFALNSSEKMCILPSGNVGIGLVNPSYPLHINGAGPGTSVTGYVFYTNTNIAYATFNWYRSIYATGGIVSGDYIAAASDIRIKKNITPVLDSLSTLQKIDIVSYDKIDYLEKGADAGVIAQQIQDILPRSIMKEERIIPNIYSLAVHSLSDGMVNILVSCNNSDIKEGSTVRIIIRKGDKEVKHEATMCNYTGTSFRITPWNDYLDDDKIFVYGTKIDDFLSVDKEQIGMLAAAGVKELHQLVLQQTSAIAAQASSIASLEARLAAAGL